MTDFKVTVRDLCRIGILTAITAILAMFFTIRVGNTLKIPLKFISVFITGVFYGPLWAAVSAAFGDVLNAFFMPVGAFMPQITLTELISGFFYGFFLYNSTKYTNKRFNLSVSACVLAQFLLDVLVVSYILAKSGIFPSTYGAIVFRLPCALLKAALQGAVIFPSRHYLRPLERIMGRSV